jgi:hypothetical protein
MGYRALLKNYIRHLMRVAGTHFVDEQSNAEVLGRRELAELRLLAAEVEREEYRRKPPETESVSGDSPPFGTR